MLLTANNTKRNTRLPRRLCIPKRSGIDNHHPLWISYNTLFALYLEALPFLPWNSHKLCGSKPLINVGELTFLPLRLSPQLSVLSRSLLRPSFCIPRWRYFSKQFFHKVFQTQPPRTICSGCNPLGKVGLIPRLRFHINVPFCTEI